MIAHSPLSREPATDEALPVEWELNIKNYPDFDHCSQASISQLKYYLSFSRLREQSAAKGGGL